ncbi:hypothetical protein [Actinocorallia lasiicapitis]
MSYPPQRWKKKAAAAEGGESPAEPSAPKDVLGGWLLGGAALLLLVLAAAQGYVSYRAQYHFVHNIKGEPLASTLEALGLDAAAVIFALLALAQARLGRAAITERFLNVACVTGSLVMNLLSADLSDPKSIVVWVLPALLYASASDRLIAVVRRQALSNRVGADDEGSAYAALAGTAMWFLRLVLAPFSTLGGFRRWVKETAPVAPGRRAEIKAPAEPATDGSAIPHVEPPAVEQAIEHLDPPVVEPVIGVERVPLVPAQAAPVNGAELPKLNGMTVPELAGILDGSAAARARLQPDDSAEALRALDTAGNGGSGIDDVTDEPAGEGEASKKEQLIAAYDAMGEAGDVRHMTRDGVGAMARELFGKVGYAHPSSALKALHSELTKRGVPK